MSVIDIDQLVQALSDDEACGPDLEYDLEMAELNRESEGKPEVQYGDAVTPAVPPEWKTVKKLCLSVFKRTRDLRVAILLLRSLMALHGMEGAADGLALIHRLLEERWDTVHPQLDPDDDMDPTMRVNALAALADGPTVVREFKDVNFIMLPGLGGFNLRMLEYTSGDVPVPEGQHRHELSTLHASMADMPEDAMTATLARINTAFDAMVGIESTLSKKVGSSNMVNLDSLIKCLKRVRDFVQGQQPDAVLEGGGDDVAANAGGGGGASAGGARTGAPISGEIASRDDVCRMLDKICAYYARYEPSSPVPLLLQRAQRLVPKSFIEIMEDMTPDGLAQLQVISGIKPVQSDEY
jgi:type VI secretion system protein ImpA